MIRQAMNLDGHGFLLFNIMKYYSKVLAVMLIVADSFHYY